MITLSNLPVFKKTIKDSEIKEILHFGQGGTTSVISFTMKTSLQNLVDLLCVLDTNDFGETFFNHRREVGIIGVTALDDGSCKLNLYLSEEYELYTQIQTFISEFNAKKFDSAKVFEDDKAKSI